MKRDRIHPPLVASWLFRRFCPNDDGPYLAGDIKEIYFDLVREKGKRAAWRWYWLQVFISAPHFLFDALFWRIAMISNYIKIALRNMKKHKGYSSINISGLAIGLTAVIFILLYVQFEISYDEFHENAGRIYRMMLSDEEFSRRSPLMPAPLAPAMKEAFPEVEQAARFSFSDNVHISANNKNFFEDGFAFADPEALEMFSCSLVKGDPQTVLTDPFSILISESMAAKYFGGEDPVGRKISYKGTHDFHVTGVLKNLPENSSITMHFVVPFTTLEKMDSFYQMNNWGAYSYHTYILLKQGIDIRTLEAKFPSLLEQNIEKNISGRSRFFFQRLRSIHLDSVGTVIILFSSIAVLILIIACVNYINLSTARSAQRMKEIGIRKVVGANRPQLVRQFLGESLLFTLLASAIAIAAVWIFLPSFNTFVGRHLQFDLLENRSFLLWLAALIALVGCVAGLYPALVVSSRKPTTIIRGQFAGVKGSALRNALVVFQFAISIVLIVATLVIRGQLHYVQARDMGFRKESILVVDIRDQRLRNNMEALQNELKRNTNILSVASSVFLPNSTNAATPITWPGKEGDERQFINLNFVDYNFVDVYGIEVVEGRNFSRDFATDAEGAFLLNESAVKAIGWEPAIGKELKHFIGGRTGKVVGVVKDFHMNPLRQAIEPLCIDLNPEWADRRLSVLIRGDRIPEMVSYIRQTMAKFAPDYPFVYQHFFDIFNRDYAFEQRLEAIIRLFSILALVVACLGLFGLASFTAQQKTKEIGIRKVLGASTNRVVLLLSGQFTKWVLIANVIAWPVAYLIMRRALRFYVYRLSPGLGFFLTAGGFALLIALLTVGYQAVRAATAKPVDSLRYE
jgi:putative ABC transport system permease protein